MWKWILVWFLSEIFFIIDLFCGTSIFFFKVNKCIDFVLWDFRFKKNLNLYTIYHNSLNILLALYSSIVNSYLILNMFSVVPKFVPIYLYFILFLFNFRTTVFKKNIKLICWKIENLYTMYLILFKIFIFKLFQTPILPTQ